MQFALSEDQLALIETARKYAVGTIIPVAAKYDESGEFPEKEIRQAHSLGLMNLIQESECGALGLGVFDACLIVEEIARGCSGFATSMVANDLALLPLKIGATKEQKARLIQPIVESGAFASFCLTEPGAGSDAGGLTTSITKKGNKYILNGAKQWITNAGHASQYTVFATIDPSKRHRGICCLVVPADAKGITRGRHENKMGQRCSNTVALTFDNVEVPEENLIGKEGEGFSIAMKTLDLSRPITAIIAVGIARAAYENACAYAKERKQFGKALAEFQAIQFMIADMITNIDAARLLTLRSAALLDGRKDASLESSMAKRFSADMAMAVTTDAVQIYGGYGYTKEYPVEKLMRDAKLLQIYEGTSQIQRIVIGREVLEKGRNSWV